MISKHGVFSSGVSLGIKTTHPPAKIDIIYWLVTSWIINDLRNWNETCLGILSVRSNDRLVRESRVKPFAVAMAGNRSRFSKYYMTGGPVFSVNFINRKNLAKLNYHMPIKKSQAKCTEYRTAGHLVFWQKLWPAVELKKVLSVTKHGFVFWAQCKPNARLTFLIDTWSFSLAGFFSICEVYWECRTAGHLVFWKPWPAVELKKVLSVTKHGFVLWAQRKPLRYTWGL